MKPNNYYKVNNDYYYVSDIEANGDRGYFVLKCRYSLTDHKYEFKFRDHKYYTISITEYSNAEKITPGEFSTILDDELSNIWKDVARKDIKYNGIGFEENSREITSRDTYLQLNDLTIQDWWDNYYRPLYNEVEDEIKNKTN